MDETIETGMEDTSAPLEPTQFLESGNSAPGSSAPGSDQDLEHTMDASPPGESSSGESSRAASSQAASSPSERGSEDRSGERIQYFGDYELLDEIARGGMGVIYKAQQTRLKRIVAIKMILGGKLATEQNIKRFLVEAEASANLDHPGIVPVYEFGEHAGSHYFSMAYIDGPSLADKVGEKPLPADEAAGLVQRIAEAVAYAHGQGVIHRDLKPANILVDHDGQPRITDFGLAKLIDADDELTQDGTIMGSVFYMPPEQASGNKSLIGPTADIYALGAILYKLLTGHPPFQAPTTMETLKQVIDQDPVPPRRINPQIPRDLETICLKCLQKDTDRRFETADELAEELDRFLAGMPIRSRPVGRIERGWRWCRRNPLPAALSALLLTALLVGAITVTTVLNHASAERRRFEQQQRSVEVLSEMVLGKTLMETEEWLQLFFQPVERQLRVTSDRVNAGLIEGEDPSEANAFLVPLIEHYPQVSSLMIADDRGREHMLLCINQPVDGAAGCRWKCRQTRRDQWHDEVRWLEWTDDSASVRRRTEQMSYDPRVRPWFQMAVRDDRPTGQIQWTNPYVFFTTKDLGITASIAQPSLQNEGVTDVVAFDLLLEDITRFTTRKHPTPNGKLVVLTADAELVALPIDDQFSDPDSWKTLFMKPFTDIGRGYATDAMKVFSLDENSGPQIRRFESDGSRWWGAAEPFRLGDQLELWILVLLPEQDLHEQLSEQG